MSDGEGTNEARGDDELSSGRDSRVDTGSDDDGGDPVETEAAGDATHLSEWADPSAPATGEATSRGQEDQQSLASFGAGDSSEGQPRDATKAPGSPDATVGNAAD